LWGIGEDKGKSGAKEKKERKTLSWGRRMGAPQMRI